jgi:hypothetical protein
LGSTLAGAATGIVSRTVFAEVSMTETVSLLPLATKSRD